MDPAILASVLERNAGILGSVKEDQLGDATPCAEFTVKDLVNHIIGWTSAFGSVATGAETDFEQKTDFTAGDFRAEYQKAAAATTAAWQADGVMEREMTMPWGPMPGAQVQRLALMEAVVHGWDLAKATGQDAEIPAQLAEPMLGGVKRIIPAGERTEGAFASEITVPDDASPTDKLVAYLGRKP